MQSQNKDSQYIDRLKKRSDFVSAKENGRSWVSKSIVLQVRANDLNQIRYGVTITKKIYPSAVKRNRVKRRLRALAMETLETAAKPGYDYVFIGRKQSYDQDYERLKSEILWCLKKLELYKEDHR